MSHAAPEPTTTQQAEPGRATWRTAVQSVLGAVLTLGLVVPLVVTIVGEELGDILPAGWYAWLLGASAIIASISAAAARIMAIPAVDGWLARLGLSSSKEI